MGGGPVSLALAAPLLAGLIALDLWPQPGPPPRSGQFVPQDIYSRVDFEVPSAELLEGKLREVRASTAATFTLNTALVDEIIRDLSALPGAVAAATQPGDLDENLQKQFQLTDQTALGAWRATTQPDQQASYQEQLARLRTRLVASGIVRAEDKAKQTERLATQVWLVHPEGRRAVNIRYELVGLDEKDELQRQVSRIAEAVQPSLRPQVRYYLLNVFANNRPLYRYDPEATQLDIDQRLAAIEADPPTELHQVGELLVPASRSVGTESQPPTGLTKAQYELLAQEQRAYERLMPPRQWWLQRVARAVLLALLTVLLCLQIVRYHPQMARDHWRGLAMLVLVLAVVLLAKCMVFLLGWNPHSVVLPVMMFAIVVTIAYGQLFAFGAAALVALLAVLLIRSDVLTVLVLLGAVAAAVFQLGEIRTRSKLVQVSAASAVVVFALVVAAGLARREPWQFVLLDAAWGAGFAALVGFIIQGLLPVIERAFRVATSITLLEWCDASKPLLKRLAMEAPGTYNHSLLLGTLCETAAEAIGARGLLARVGAYYHDIGKINKPDYFVENQSGMASRHTKLAPAMSLLVIIGHVKDGLELARQYGLPPVLHEFIVSHHGTTLLQYFYQAAVDARKRTSDRPPDEVEFRYPGPKPRSREAAILMLADAAESSVRSMVEPTAGRIENQVHTMVSRRLMDGQLDECDLTFRQVHEIENSLIKSLMGIYHSRIAYPRPAGQRPSAAEREAEQRRAQAASQNAQSPESPAGPAAESPGGSAPPHTPAPVNSPPPRDQNPQDQHGQTASQGTPHGDQPTPKPG